MVGTTPLARLKARRYSDNQPRDEHGRWTSGGGGDDSSGGGDSGGGGGSISSLAAAGGVQPITADELAGTGPGATSGPGASRPVSQAEFNQIAAQGQQRLSELNDAKVSPESVNYGPSHGLHHCGSCSMYRPEGTGKTGSCTLVAGLIEADHVCDRWVAKQRHLTPLARRRGQRESACPTR